MYPATSEPGTLLMPRPRNCNGNCDFARSADDIENSADVGFERSP
jgi:hypothetical protein